MKNTKLQQKISTKITVVRFCNTSVQAVMEKVFTGLEYEQVGNNVDVWFDDRRIALEAMKDYGTGCEIINASFGYIR